jgi:hypothetical protein
MKKLIVLLLTLLLLIPATASAQEPGTPEDNACNEGGLMEGDCTTEWHWECGWYLARWQANGGWNTMPFFPDWCNPDVLLPARPLADENAEGIIQICRTYFNPDERQICLSSNNTGYQLIVSTQVIFVRSYFGSFGNIGNCPPAPAGFTSFLGLFNTSDYATAPPYNVFSSNELFNILGLGPQECYYE